MSADLNIQSTDKFASVDGLRLRYVEEGRGPVVLLLHGASLGSSADVFLRNIGSLARAGFRVIAYDQPGFGLSDVPTDPTADYRRDSIPKFLDAIGVDTVALVGHSQAGNPAVQLALSNPERYSHVIVLGTGSLLPPMGGQKSDDSAAQQRLERRMATHEPTIEDTRKLLEANLFHHDLITPDELALRHARSIGKNFEAFVMRNQAVEAAPPKALKTPLWQRLIELKMPLLMIYGRDDRAHAYERAMLLKEKFPQLNLHIASNCKHLVPWDAADEFQRLAVPFLKS